MMRREPKEKLCRKTPAPRRPVQGARGLAAAAYLSRILFFSILFAALLVATLAGCRTSQDKRSVAPRSMRDVPAQRLAYTFQPDTPAPADLKDASESSTRLETILRDFDERRKDEALVRTVTSPDGQRALALYETGESQQGEFRIDLYGSAGNFLRNVSPPELAGVFASTVAWSPDGNYIAFIGRKSLTPQPTPLQPDALPEAIAPPDPSATALPAFAPVPVYSTEQLYVCNRDGFDIKPLTTRDGLIYFYLAWSPDSRSLVALACTENEWNARPVELLPAGRPRLVELSGQERLLDDGLTDVLPVWSPDASKVATAFETDVAIYDAVTATPTSARMSLRDPLLAASVDYDEKNLKQPTKAAESNSNQQAPTQTSSPPVSFSPVVRLEWERPEILYVETGFVRIYASETVSKYMRWHKLSLSVQAAQIGRLHRRAFRNKHARAA